MEGVRLKRAHSYDGLELRQDARPLCDMLEVSAAALCAASRRTDRARAALARLRPPHCALSGAGRPRVGPQRAVFRAADNAAWSVSLAARARRQGTHRRAALRRVDADDPVIAPPHNNNNNNNKNTFTKLVSPLYNL